MGSIGSGFGLIFTVLTASHWPLMQHHTTNSATRGLAKGFGTFEGQFSISPHTFVSNVSHVFMLSLSRRRQNISSLRFSQQLLSTSAETNKAAVTSGFMRHLTVTAGATSPLQSLAGFTARSTVAANSPGYLFMNCRKLLLSRGASRVWRCFTVGGFHLRSKADYFDPKFTLFWGGFDPKSVRKASEQIYSPQSSALY